MTRLHGGMDRRQLDALLCDLGGSVTVIPRTGEVQYSHPMIAERPRANGRRKDAPRHLVAFVHRVERVLTNGPDMTAAA